MAGIQESRAFQTLCERHRTFWAEQSILLLKRASNEPLCAIAMGSLAADEMLHYPIYFRHSLERRLADAEKTVEREEQEGRQKHSFHTEFSRSGGRAKKSDVLKLLIEAIVARKPNITEPELIEELKSEQNSAEISVLDDVGEAKEISFVNKGRPKDVPLSGLKNRLYRAKKKVRRRSR